MEIYKKGDKVRIVEYGSAMWFNKNSLQMCSIEDMMCNGKPILSENANIIWYDMNPELVGKIGIIDIVHEILKDDEISATYSIKPQWKLDEAIRKTAWYNQVQLQLVADKDCDHRWIEKEDKFFCTKCKGY